MKNIFVDAMIFNSSEMLMNKGLQSVDIDCCFVEIKKKQNVKNEKNILRLIIFHQCNKIFS